MKKVEDVVKIPSYVEHKVEKFQTEDGRKFNTEKEALSHEENLNKKKFLESKYKIKSVDEYDYGLDYNDVQSCKLIYIEEMNDETKEDLSWLYPYLKYEPLTLENFKNGWNFFTETQYDSNCYGVWSGYDLYIDNVNNIIKNKMEELERLKEYEN